MYHAIHLEFMGGGDAYFRRFKTAREMRHELRALRKTYRIHGTTTRVGIFFGIAEFKTI